MNDLIREYYDSDLCEVNRVHELSESAAEVRENQEVVYTKLKECLSAENFKLFEAYVEDKDIIDNEEMFRAYCCGMRAMARLGFLLFNEA